MSPICPNCPLYIGILCCVSCFHPVLTIFNKAMQIDFLAFLNILTRTC